ncbi:phenylacetaldoxime dehydratase family protein [Nocardioides mangrovicus]|uniref:Phenylacetaldoxime dehydratase family protein n=1 Tax=Nocardioides mangrovicus TaxID=2478913 RepID=A0A3L8P0G8_9ACTN|nr:phenylacetaldoxime dehydratase family protein [Nocardioides mangrovicus]RLV48501.1 phenylacetaldoxime dehydratase family protein [Nocardioides mangrovicus]
MTTSSPSLEPSIAPHLLRASRTPKHEPGSYLPAYPAFSARFGEDVTSLVMAYFGVQARDTDSPVLAESSAHVRAQFAETDGPASWDRAAYVDAEGFTTVISIAYWSDPDAFDRWYDVKGVSWTDAARVTDGVGHFLELVRPSVERFETVFSAADRDEGLAGAKSGLSGMIEEHAYWGSMRDRLPLSQTDPLYPSGSPRLVTDGPVRTVVLHENACLIRSGQDITDTGDVERRAYLGDVEPSLRAGMEFLRDEGGEIGCYDNRYMRILDEEDQPTDRTFGLSWWRDISALEDWAASHPTHVEIFGVAMRHLSSFGPETRLRLYHEVTVPAATEQRFVYAGCHDATGLLRAVL